MGRSTMRCGQLLERVVRVSTVTAILGGSWILTASPAAAVIDGDPASPQHTGVVMIELRWPDGGMDDEWPPEPTYDSEICSGTLITNDWILTAAHCWNRPIAAGHPPGSLDLSTTVNFGRRETPFAQVVEVQIHPAWSGRATPDSTDVALIRLNLPVELDGVTWAWQRGFYTGTNASLGVGRNIDCYGYGRDQWGDGWGRLRRGTVHIDGFVDKRIVLKGDQLPWKGDSGGPCMLDTPAGEVIVSVISTSSAGLVPPVWDSKGVGAEHFRDWVLHTIYTPYPVLPNLFEDSWSVDGSTSLRGNIDDDYLWWPAAASDSDWVMVLGVRGLRDGSAEIWDHAQPGSDRFTGGDQSLIREMRGDALIRVTTGAAGGGQLRGSAIIRAAVTCHVSECFTTSIGSGGIGSLPDNTLIRTEWDPCRGGSFSWRSDHSFEPESPSGEDFAMVGPQRITGWNSIASGAAPGPIDVSVSTNASVESPGIFRLHATCDAWQI